MAAPAILQIDDGTLCDAAAEPSVRRRRRPSPVSNKTELGLSVSCGSNNRVYNPMDLIGQLLGLGDRAGSRPDPNRN
jgi:hypothetical protein